MKCTTHENSCGALFKVMLAFFGTLCSFEWGTRWAVFVPTLPCSLHRLTEHWHTKSWGSTMSNEFVSSVWLTSHSRHRQVFMFMLVHIIWQKILQVLQACLELASAHPDKPGMEGCCSKYISRIVKSCLSEKTLNVWICNSTWTCLTCNLHNRPPPQQPQSWFGYPLNVTTAVMNVE